MMVSREEASKIAAKYASSKPWMTKHSHLHVQEEVKVMQMMGDDSGCSKVVSYLTLYSCF